MHYLVKAFLRSKGFFLFDPLAFLARSFSCDETYLVASCCVRVRTVSERGGVVRNVVLVWSQGGLRGGGVPYPRHLRNFFRSL